MFGLSMEETGYVVAMLVVSVSLLFLIGAAYCAKVERDVDEERGQ
jgi:hypothetical protein